MAAATLTDLNSPGPDLTPPSQYRAAPLAQLGHGPYLMHALSASPWDPAPSTQLGYSRYLGHCQICDVTRHSARQCNCLSTLTLASLSPTPARAPRPTLTAPYPYTKIHYFTSSHSLDWVIDSGAFHHVTTNLASLALHEPYTASDIVIIGDGSGLSIAHIGSFFLTSLPTPLLFNNVLHVLAMSKNLISVSTLCAYNPINFYFLTLSFRCRIVTRGHCGSRWCLLLAEVRLHSVFCFGLSFTVRSSISTISMWHNCLGYPSLPLFHNFLSFVSISFPKEHLCSLSCNSGNINKSHKLHFSKSNITSTSSLDVIFSDV